MEWRGTGDNICQQYAVDGHDSCAGYSKRIDRPDHGCNPLPNPGTSPAQPLAVMAAAPAATVNGSTLGLAADGSGNYVLTVTGTDFLSGSVAQWNGAGLTTDYVSPWQVSATITALDYAALPAAITVNNPSGTSAMFEMQTINSQGNGNGGGVVGESAAIALA